MSSKKKPIQAVNDDYVPPRREPMTVSEATETGSRLDELIAMRRVLARAIDNPKTLARELPPLTKRQNEVSREIETLRAQEAEEVAHESSGGKSNTKWRPEAI